MRMPGGQNGGMPLIAQKSEDQIKAEVSLTLQTAHQMQIQHGPGVSAEACIEAAEKFHARAKAYATGAMARSAVVLGNLNVPLTIPKTEGEES